MVGGGKGLKWGATAVVACGGGGSGVVVAVAVMVMLVGCC